MTKARRNYFRRGLWGWSSGVGFVFVFNDAEIWRHNGILNAEEPRYQEDEDEDEMLTMYTKNKAKQSESRRRRKTTAEKMASARATLLIGT